MKHYRDGLDDWHHQHVVNLMGRLLRHRVDDSDKRKALLHILADRYALSTHAITAVIDIIAVGKTQSGVSWLKTRGGRAVELRINWGGLEDFQAGAEFPEYASYADDPVIGSRWAQNVDEAITLALAHEFAHYLTRLVYRTEDIKPHGDEFKAIYRDIRALAVNPMLAEFAADEAQQLAARHEARLVKKIQALQKMAHDPTSNENEAERAVAQLQGLLAKHGLASITDLATHKPHFIERRAPVIRRDGFKPLLQYCFAVARFCGVEGVVLTPANTALGGQEICYFGAPSDVSMAIYLSELVFSDFYRCSADFKTSAAYQVERQQGTHHRSIITSFRRAYLARIKKRLLESRDAVEHSWACNISDGKELMAAKDQALNRAFTLRYPKLGTRRNSAASGQKVASADAAGKKAANKLNLNRPVGRGGPLLLN